MDSSIQDILGMINRINIYIAKRCTTFGGHAVKKEKDL